MKTIVYYMRLFLFVITISLVGIRVFSQPAVEKKDFHLYILAGQSNMAGRGLVEDEDKTVDPSIWVLNKSNQWTAAIEPLHFDKPDVAGVGPGLAFAKRMIEFDSSKVIGLIPCAIGGSSIDFWQPSKFYQPTKSYPYDDVLARTKAAMQRGELKGILWHQGESDSDSAKAKLYARNLRSLVERIRYDLNLKDLPFVAGTLAEFYLEKHPYAKLINAAITALPHELPNTAVVYASGLSHKGDNTHFDRKSARMLGESYAIVFQTRFCGSSQVQSALATANNKINFPYQSIGTIKPRSTNEIQSSNWILGCETLDRDMTDYEQYKEWIAPLGIKRLRMQAGWAKTEKVKGQYNWEWLDKIIHDAHKRGFQVWLEASYGNPLYPGGGGINLSAGIPASEEALKAWDKWVEALVTRYKDKIKDWEIWNEPNFGDNQVNRPEKVAELNIRSAEIIKRVQPDAVISGLSMGHIDLQYADVFFRTIHEKGKMNLFDNMTYHDYVYNPDANYGRVAELRKILDKYSTKLKLRQGENGSPSFGGGGRGALGDYNWTELTQAKWNTRRMLGDLGHDIESSILGIIDMNYTSAGSPIQKLNVKGLLQSDSTKKAIRPKLAYYAMQHVTSIFDHSLQRIASLHPTFNMNSTLPAGQVRYNTGSDRSFAVYGYEHRETRKQIFTIWVDEYIPTDNYDTRNITFTIINGNFDEPVFIDIITGVVYEIPASQWLKEGSKHIFKNLPVYDAPILIAEKKLVHIQ